MLNILTPLNYALLYFMLGLLWGIFVEHMDRRTGRKLPRTLTAIVVIVVTWPVMFVVFIITFLKNLFK